MVFAAGFGSRLRPYTDDRPKALVEIDGLTLLERVLRRLLSAGVSEVVINQYYRGEQITAFLDSRRDTDGRVFGLTVHLSPEEVLLDTGGGLINAAGFFAGSDEPFFVHNVDVLSEIDLGAMRRQHEEAGNLVTLAVMARDSSRKLLFDQRGLLCGRIRNGVVEPGARAAETREALGFCGIHVVSPKLFHLTSETGVFSIIDVYLRLAAAGERIGLFRVDGARWRDVGRPSDVYSW